MEHRYLFDIWILFIWCKARHMVPSFLVLWRRSSFHGVFCNGQANLHSNQQHARAPVFLCLCWHCLLFIFSIISRCVFVAHCGYWLSTSLIIIDALPFFMHLSVSRGFFLGISLQNHCPFLIVSCFHLLAESVLSVLRQSSVAPRNHACLVFLLLPCGGGVFTKGGGASPKSLSRIFFHIFVLLALHFSSCV